MTNLILPGLHGSGPDHWQSWWLSVDRDACLVKQDDWDTPRLDPWSGQVAAAVRSAPGAILIAHSLGCALVAWRPDVYGWAGYRALLFGGYSAWLAWRVASAAARPATVA